MRDYIKSLYDNYDKVITPYGEFKMTAVLILGQAQNTTRGLSMVIRFWNINP